MGRKIKVLWVSDDHIRDNVRISQAVELFEVSAAVLSLDGWDGDTEPDVLILDKKPEEIDMYYFRQRAVPYRVFYTREDLMMEEELRDFFICKRAQLIERGGLQYFLDQLPSKYWYGQYGSRLSLEDCDIYARTGCSVKFQGHKRAIIRGKFGTRFEQLISWRKSIPMDYEEKSVEIWPEISLEDGVEAKFRVLGFTSAEAEEPSHVWEFDARMHEPYVFMRYGNLSLSVSLQVKGSGTIEIGAIHYRDARNGAGALLPGGVRNVDYMGNEVFSYFDPGDLKPPLIVYFCEENRQERFYGVHKMRELGTPCLFIMDSRMVSGSFYTGTDSYEMLIERIIQRTVDELGFCGEQLIFAGTSMGTYGALYYAPIFIPKAVVLQKPLSNLEVIARNAQKVRPEGYPESLDLRFALEERISVSGNDLWHRFDGADFKNTRFAVCYMSEDDYDPDAYRDLLRHLERQQACIFGKEIIGRHNDNTKDCQNWFSLQFKKILKEEFDRDIG